LFPPWLLAEASGHFVAIDLRHADVQKDHVRAKLGSNLEPIEAVRVSWPIMRNSILKLVAASLLSSTTSSDLLAIRGRRGLLRVRAKLTLVPVAVILRMIGNLAYPVFLDYIPQWSRPATMHS
jgi:hypothetical protein